MSGVSSSGKLERSSNNEGREIPNLSTSVSLPSRIRGILNLLEGKINKALRTQANRVEIIELPLVDGRDLITLVL